MAKRTIQERFDAALQARGWSRDTQSRSSRFHVWINNGESNGSDRKFFTGSAGSLRVGPNAGKSIPVNEKFKLKLLAEEGAIR